MVEFQALVGNEKLYFRSELIRALPCKKLLRKLFPCISNNVTVIFAGYEAPLNQFFSMNPGLASRVPKTLMFPDYEPNELLDILSMRLKEFGHKLDDATKETLLQLFTQKINHCRCHRLPFSNGRYSRNVADALHAQHALNYKKNSGIGTTIAMQDIDFNSLLALD